MNTEKFCYIAPSADVIGDVHLAENANVWYRAVLRAEEEPVTVGAGSNIQDGCVVHTDAGFPTTVGRNVTVGHGAILHGCTIGDNSLIGMGAIVLNGASVGENCVIGAGALVPGGKQIPDGSMAFGNPAKVQRLLTEEEIDKLPMSAAHYTALAAKTLEACPAEEV
ncbi:MAG: gamma carbonic anhydrase family protein [Clostridia bacterium]|nr:gamma carbonic anhydrase family protein [Clostridia bacterium]